MRRLIDLLVAKKDSEALQQSPVQTISYTIAAPSISPGRHPDWEMFPFASFQGLALLSEQKICVRKSEPNDHFGSSSVKLEAVDCRLSVAIHAGGFVPAAGARTGDLALPPRLAVRA